MPSSGYFSFLLKKMSRNNRTNSRCQCPLRATSLFYINQANQGKKDYIMCQCPLRANSLFYYILNREIKEREGRVNALFGLLPFSTYTLHHEN